MVIGGGRLEGGQQAKIATSGYDSLRSVYAEKRESCFALAAIASMCENCEMDLERTVQLRQFLRLTGNRPDAEFARLVTEPLTQRGWKVA